MTVWIDYREGSAPLATYSPLVELVASKQALVCELEGADFAIPGRGPGERPIMVGGEVKSYEDFLASSLNGRLQSTQLPGLLTYDVRWLVLYGGIRCSSQGSIELRKEPKRARKRRGGPGIAIRPQTHRLWFPYSFGTGGKELSYLFYTHRLFEITTQGIGVWHEADAKGAAAFVGFLHEFWSMPWSEHSGLRTVDRSHALPLMPHLTSRQKARLKVAFSLPYLGFTRALAALHHFRSPYAMFTATAEQWREVDGIGKVIADEIVEFIHSE